MDDIAIEAPRGVVTDEQQLRNCTADLLATAERNKALQDLAQLRADHERVVGERDALQRENAQQGRQVQHYRDVARRLVNELNRSVE